MMSEAFLFNIDKFSNHCCALSVGIQASCNYTIRLQERKGTKMLLLWVLEYIYNHRQKSKLALLALLRTRQTRIQLHLPNPAPTPHTMLKTSTCNFI